MKLEGCCADHAPSIGRLRKLLLWGGGKLKKQIQKKLNNVIFQWVQYAPIISGARGEIMGGHPEKSKMSSTRWSSGYFFIMQSFLKSKINWPAGRGRYRKSTRHATCCTMMSRGDSHDCAVQNRAPAVLLRLR